MRGVAALLLSALAGLADEPPPPVPGILDPLIAPIAPLVITPRPGTARTAATHFYEGHVHEKAGDADAALRSYLAFQETEGRRDLPARFRAAADARVRRLLAALETEYAAACALYTRDRAQGLDALRRLAGRHPTLPHGRAARALVESDALLAAIRAARALDTEGRRAEALAPLEATVKANPEGLFLYEAKTLLKELGGPDLFEPADPPGEAKEGGGEEKEKKGEESVIDVGGGG
ncbi:MAG: hypothetical protein ACT4PV_09350 [Planctomycetaceae bacterium]